MLDNRIFTFIILGLLIASPLFGQNSVGLISHNSEEASQGYNLFFSHNQEKVLLIDNEGQLIHYWDDQNDFRPGNSAYLLPNGDLIKCKRPSNFSEDAIWAGGGGAFVEIVDWDGNAKASFELNDENSRLHHDIGTMPNGNVLMIAWAKVDSTTAANAGRDSEIITQSQVWSEKIIEWNPTTDQIVWEWDAFDHLIQDRFPNRDHYGVVQDNPSKIDINYDEHDGHPDWLHINSIDYNDALDQIVLSVPYFNEFWVIDHNTTTAEAAGTKGDLVYRWGNPKAHKGNTEVAQELFFQHDVHWVNPNAQPGDEDFGSILLYNNRLPNETSVAYLVETIDPNTGAYFENENASSNAVTATYAHPDLPEIAYSTGLSSAQRLPNGNHLILAGRHGYAFELNPSGEVVWEYRIPLRGGEIVPQGTELSTNNNITFRLNRYPLDFSAFSGKDLSQKGLLEETVFDDDDDDVITSIGRENISAQLELRPNPASSQVTIRIPSGMIGAAGDVLVVNSALGSIQSKQTLEHLPEDLDFNVQTLNTGVYLVIIETDGDYAYKKLIISR